MSWNPIKDIGNAIGDVGSFVGDTIQGGSQMIGGWFGGDRPQSPQQQPQASPWQTPEPPKQQQVVAGDASRYPAMPNDYGLGNTGEPAPTPGRAAESSYLQRPLNVTMNETSSRGFNPWSLMGESNARGPS